jgi:hypothetical protein
MTRHASNVRAAVAANFLREGGTARTTSAQNERYAEETAIGPSFPSQGMPYARAVGIRGRGRQAHTNKLLTVSAHEKPTH